MRECEDALRDLFLAAQEGITYPDTTLSRLVVYKNMNSGLLLCGGRFEMFNEEKTAVPILPYETWVSTLLAQEAHKVNHGVVAGHYKPRVIKGQRLAKKIAESFVTCKKTTVKHCQQVMSDLPPERARGPAAPFEFTILDLFGSCEVKKRVKLKCGGSSSAAWPQEPYTLMLSVTSHLKNSCWFIRDSLQ